MRLYQPSSVLAYLVSSLVASLLTQHVAGDQLSFVEHLVTDTAGDQLSGVAIADMNKDGHVDILSTAGGGIVWYESNGATPPVFSPNPIRSNATFAFIGVIDIDSDGDQDIVGSNSGTMRWYESDGQSPPMFTEYVIASEPDGGAMHCTFADIDRDGDIDIVSGGASAAGIDLEVAWYENNGESPPTFLQHVVDTRPFVSTPNAVFVEDFDRDGDPDILYCNQSLSVIPWLQNNGASPPEFTRVDIPATSVGWHGVHSADFDCDGDPDIVAGTPNIANPGIWWYESDGQSPPMFTERLVVSGDQPEKITCADLDQDGDVDVLAAQPTQDEMSWYENISGKPGEPPTFLKRVVFSQAESQPVHVLTSDLDCDGDLDIVLSTRGDGSVRWFENVTCPGDTNGDGVVNSLDLLALLVNWGPCP